MYIWFIYKKWHLPTGASYGVKVVKGPLWELNLSTRYKFSKIDQIDIIYDIIIYFFNLINLAHKFLIIHFSFILSFKIIVENIHQKIFKKSKKLKRSSRFPSKIFHFGDHNKITHVIILSIAFIVTPLLSSQIHFPPLLQSF